MTNLYCPEGMQRNTCEMRESLLTLSGLEHAMECGRILEAVVLLCDSQMRLHFDLGGIRGIMERSEVMYCRSGEVLKDIAVITRVGKPTCFKIMEITYDNGEPIAILSRRLAQMECFEHYISTLIPGDLIPAKVTHMESFGAFVDIGCGIPSLLSVDSISVSRISHPSDRLRIGDHIHALVKMIDHSNGRIFVSMRELLGTWEENASKFEAGQTVFGIIRSMESYGVFVELAPNLAGLAELREGTRDKQLAVVGQAVAVYIKSIIPERMKIKLVLIDTYKGECSSINLKYYIDANHTQHISRWRYSPKDCRRVIESVFD